MSNVVPLQEIGFVLVGSVFLSLVSLYALWPWARSGRRLAVVGIAMSLGIVAWNTALNVGDATGFNVDGPFLGLSFQDIGSAVLAFATTAFALGLLTERGETANRVVGAAAIVGLVTLIVDRFG